MKSNNVLMAIWVATAVLLAISIMYIRSNHLLQDVDDFPDHSEILSENL